MGQQDVLMEVAHRVGLVLDTGQLSSISSFLDDLYVANATKNLTRVPQAEATVRHIADSLLLVPYIPAGSRVLDIGCGPGFPAWVIALARPDCHVTAMDSNAKMTGFLLAHPLSNLVVVTARAEVDPDRESYDLVTGRAVAPLGIQAEMAAPWAKVGGAFVPFRLATERPEVEAANLGTLGIRLESCHEAELAPGEPVRLFPIFRKTGRTRPDFPRAWARMKSRPLGRS